jgi:serine/tyrosine/threonine adenylyltransferase
MHHLGVPTSRAASIVVSNKTQVVRDKLYDGNPIMEKCAVVMRVAPTFMRFGSFEIFLPFNQATGRTGPSFGLQ